MLTATWVPNLLVPDRVKTSTRMATARLIRRNELDELLTLYQMLNPDDPEIEENDELLGQWHDMLRDHSLDIVVIEHDDQIVSSCVLSITENLTRNAHPFGVIENVITHKGYRKNGFGKLCLQKATEIAENRGCYKIMLLTGSDEKWKHDFYEGCGFDKEEKTGYVICRYNQYGRDGKTRKPVYGRFSVVRSAR